jgi:hypothetical protein
MTLLLSRNQRVPGLSLKVGLEELLPYLGTLGADLAERAAPVLVTALVVLGPIAALRVTTGLLKVNVEVLHPFVNLVCGLKDKGSNKATEAYRNLGSVHNNALHRGMECYLGRYRIH